jgi:DNA-binding winged helix-turn-helix (wHTH) protein/TolB-like protein/Tfp pilus assembly protein PilF
MNLPAKHFYEFGPFRIDAEQRLLTRDGELVPLTPKVFETLFCLVERRGQIVLRDELMNRVWPDTFVEEGNLTFNISLLRKALGENPESHPYIETIPRRGYRFVAPVREVNDEPTDLVVEEHLRAEIVLDEEDENRETADASGESGEVLKNDRSLAAWSRRVGRKRMAFALALLGLIIAVLYLRTAQQQTSPPLEGVVRSIAVLPFRPLTSESGDDYLGPGLADALILKLSSLEEIMVRPTTAILKYAAPRQDLLAAGRELRVDALLDGRFQKSGDHIRVTLQLLRVTDGAILWAEKFDEHFSNIFTVQDSIAEQVAHKLVLRLGSEERKRLARHYTENPEAYQLYLKGRYFWNKMSEEGLQKSIGYFRQAIEKDPTYALAYAGLADAYWGLSTVYLEPKEAMPKVRAAASRALEIDESLGEAHTSLGLVKFRYDWAWQEAETEFKLAIELKPSYAFAHQSYGLYLVCMGGFEQAVAEMRRAEELDPLSVEIIFRSAIVLYFARQYDQAIKQFQKVFEIDSNAEVASVAHAWIGRYYFQKRKFSKGLAELQEARRMAGDEGWLLAMSAEAYAFAGERAEAQRLLGGLLEESRIRYFPAMGIAGIYTALKDDNEALRWLQQAYERREESMISIKVNPMMDGLRSDPRFADLLEKMHLDD